MAICSSLNRLFLTGVSPPRPRGFRSAPKIAQNVSARGPGSGGRGSPQGQEALDEAEAAHTGGDHPEAARGGGAAGGRSDGGGGEQEAWGEREHVPPLACAVRGHEGGAGEEAEGAGEGERAAEADRGGAGGGPE